MKKKRVFSLLVLFLIFTLSACSINDFININDKTNGSSIVTTTTKDNTTSENDNTKSQVISTKKIGDDEKEVSSIKMVSINDTHGQLITEGYLMGIAELEGAIKYLEKEDDQKYIRLMCGDLFQGSYVARQTYGYCLIEALNAANFDCMVLGNHEFDWGLDQIAIYWDGDETNGEANFPLLCANLIDKRTGERPSWVQPYTIINYYGIKVGVIGCIGEDIESTIATDYVEDYEFTEEFPIVEKYAKELKSNGCDAIVYASHSYDSNLFTEISNCIDETCPIDAFFAAHTHENIEEYYLRQYDDYMIPLIQSYTKTRSFGTITLNLDSTNKPVSGTYSHYLQKADCVQNSEEDKEVLKVVAKYQQIIDRGNEVLGVIDKWINSKQKVGDLMMDAMNAYCNGDIGMLNSGGIRVSSFNKGNITFANVFEAFPFDNYGVYVYMTGANLKLFISRNTSNVYSSSFNQSTIDDNKIYTLTTSDYVANKSNKIILRYTTDNTIHSTGLMMYDILAEYIRNNTPIK